MNLFFQFKVDLLFFLFYQCWNNFSKGFGLVLHESSDASHALHVTCMRDFIFNR